MKLKKFKNQKFSFMTIVAFMAIMLLTGCGDKTTVGDKTGGAGYTGGDNYYDIVGTVLNDAGDPIEHVFIEIIDFVMISGGDEPFVASVRSDGNGEFGIRVPGDNVIRQVTLRFAFQDVVTYVQDVEVTANQEVDLGTITLTQMSQKPINDSTISNTMSDNVRANAYVTIGANALRYSDGTPFTTVVPAGADPITATVAIGYVDTTSNPGLFPDNFYSMDGGSLKLFSTYGILEVKVTTDNGNSRLSLASGQTATISIPVGELVNVNSPDFPATVDLWYYDEDAADWVLEQEDGLTYDALTRSFTGSVNHFSTFNAGYTFESKYAKATVMEKRGMICPSEEYDEEDKCTVDEVPYLIPLRGSTITIFSNTFSPYGVWNAKYTAGDDGKVPDSMDPSIAGLLYHDSDGYFVPVPGTGGLMTVLNYTNPTNDEAGSVGPDFVSFEAGESKTSRDYILELASSAYLEGKVEYEKGEQEWPKRYFAIFTYDPESTDDPTAGGTFGGTISWIGITTDGKIDQFNSGTLAGTLLANVGPETTYAVANNDWFSTTTYQGGFSPAVDVYLGGSADPVEKDPLFGYPLITTGKIGDVLNLRVVLPSPPGDVVYTHINGSIVIPDGVDDPTKLWVVVETTFNDRPISVRASVDADGNWPADDGTFNPVTVPGVEGLFIQVPAEADLTITVGDYVTDPLTPKIYYTYEYTSLDEGEVGEDGTITTYTTDTFIPAPNAYIEGWVTYNAEVGADLRIVFTKENPGEDDKPVTVTTSGSGKFSAKLEFDTDYIIEIWDDTDPLYPLSIYADYYTSNPDGEVGYITDNTMDPVYEGLIQIGDEYSLVATVIGEIFGEYGPDLLVTFTPETGDPITAITNEDGEYTADLELSTDYEVTVSTQTGGVADEQIFPSLDYPNECAAEGEEGYYEGCTDDVLPFTSGDTDTNFYPDAVAVLDIQIGSTDFIPVIPEGVTAIYGTVTNADGTPKTYGGYVFLENGVSGAGNVVIFTGAEGIVAQWGTTGYLHEDYAVLKPNTSYTVEGYSFYPTAGPTGVIIIDEFTSGDSGVVQELNIVLPASGVITETFIKGTVTNADGTPKTYGGYVFLENGVSGAGNVVIFTGADGIVAQWGTTGYLHEDYAVLKPNTSYTVEGYSFYPTAGPTGVIIIDEFTSDDAGVVQKLNIVLPASGAITDTYVYGIVTNSDGTPKTYGGYVFLENGVSGAGNVVIFTGADGIVAQWGTTGYLHEDYAVLKPNTSYTVEGYSFYPSAGPTGVIYIDEFTSDDAGVMKKLSITLPAAP